jgi:hypothetical protein
MMTGTQCGRPGEVTVRMALPTGLGSVLLCRRCRTAILTRYRPRRVAEEREDDAETDAVGEVQVPAVRDSEPDSKADALPAVRKAAGWSGEQAGD